MKYIFHRAPSFIALSVVEGTDFYMLYSKLDTPYPWTTIASGEKHVTVESWAADALLRHFARCAGELVQ